jgi:hypothetical protein
LEGYGTKTSTIFIWNVDGEEVVYDFVTLKRAKFRFTESKEFFGLFCGIELGASVGGSGYAGAFHFPINEPEVHFSNYGGPSAALSLGVGVPLLGDIFPGSGLLGGELGVSVFAATPGAGFAGIPSVDLSNPYYGASVALGGGASKSFRLYGASTMFLNYEMEGVAFSYPSAEQMAWDIRTGAHSVLPDVSEGLLSHIRNSAANHLLWMYELHDAP